MTDPILEIREKLSAIVPDSTEEADLLNELAWQLRVRETDQAIETARRAYELANRLRYQRGIAFAKRNMGMVAYFESDYHQALNFFDDALAWFEANNERYGAGTVYNVLGMANWSFGDFQKGIDYTLLSLEIAREFNDRTGEAWILNALGGYHFDMKEFVEAQHYFEESCKIFEEIDLPTGIARAYTGLGNVLAADNQYERAMDLYQKSLRLHSEADNQLGASRALNDIGLIYQKQGKNKQALNYLQQSLAMRQKLKYSAGVATTLLNIADLLLQQKNPDEAREYYKQGLQSAKAALSKPKMVRAYHGLSLTCKSLGEFKDALRYHERFHELEEEVYHEDVNSRIKNMQTAYQAESAKKEAEIYRLKNVELKETNNRLQDTIQQLNAAQAQLIQAGKMAALGKLVAGIAHELNSPIGSIHSAADVANRGVKRVSEWARQQNLDADSSLEKTLQIIDQNNHTILSAADRVTHIVDGLKRFSRLDSARIQTCDINTELDNTLALLNHELSDRIAITKDYSEIPGIRCYPAELNQVLMNLLLNAVQAIEKEGTISIRTRVVEESVEIVIADSGIGIPPAMIETLFEPDFSFGKERVKMRTGLYNSYSILQKHGGTIRVNSTPGEGSMFTVRLPFDHQD